MAQNQKSYDNEFKMCIRDSPPIIPVADEVSPDERL